MLRLSIIKKYTAPTAWLLGVLMAVAPIGTHSIYAVLCIGSDGHIEPEVLGDSGCDLPADYSRTSADDDAKSGGGMGESHCGGCSDIPLPSGGDADCGSFRTSSGPSGSTILAVVAVLPQSVIVTPADPAATGAMNGHPTPAQVLAELQGVVLLI